MACDRAARRREASPWLKRLPASGSAVVLDLPLDANFELRLQAARRFWLALEHRPLGTPPLACPTQKRHCQRPSPRQHHAACRKEIAIAKSRKPCLEVIVLRTRARKQTICAAEPFDLLSWGGASCAFAAAHCSTKARMTVHELLGDQWRPSVLCSIFFCWHGMIADRMRSLRSISHSLAPGLLQQRGSIFVRV